MPNFLQKMLVIIGPEYLLLKVGAEIIVGHWSIYHRLSFGKILNLDRQIQNYIIITVEKIAFFGKKKSMDISCRI